MKNRALFSLGVMLFLVTASCWKSKVDEAVALRQLLATLHRIEDSVRGDHGAVRIHVLTAGTACATRSVELCRIPLTSPQLEITEYVCRPLYRQVLQGGVLAIEAVRIHAQADGRTIELEDIIEPLDVPPPTSIHICH